MTNTDNFNHDSFSHGQIKSKLWLCEQIEPCLPEQPNVTILGSWYNVLGFMLLTRMPKRYKHIRGIDIDKSAIEVSNKICDAWVLDENIVTNVQQDVSNVDYASTNVVINCSPEHIEGKQWFKNIPYGTLVCIQSSNVTDPNEPWNIKNPSPDIESFRNQYELETTHFCETLPIRYGNWGYDRFMLIGIK